jgi:hypothetical protein
MVSALLPSTRAERIIDFFLEIIFVGIDTVL